MMAVGSDRPLPGIVGIGRYDPRLVRFRTRHPALPIALILFAVAACTSDTSGREASATTTTTRPATTSTAATTTTLPRQTVTVDGELPGDLGEALATFYSYAADRRNPTPDVPPGLLGYLSTAPEPSAQRLTAEAVVGTLLEDASVAAVSVGPNDLILAVDEGDGWRIVGADLGGHRFGPWFGDPPRTVLILGSDARPGEDQQRFRADSIHVVTAVPSAGTGAVVGFPRDSYIETSLGDMKLTSVMAGRGPEVMREEFEAYFELPVDGYIVTGFRGFEDLVGELGTLLIDLPRSVPSRLYWPGFSAGEQELSPQRTLELARTRKGVPGGDFTRSWNQGLIMLAAMRMIQLGSVEDVPILLEQLVRHVWTDLSATDLIQLGAAAFALDPDTVTNTVLPGTLGRAGRSSVVLLDPDADDILEDLADDGLVDEDPAAGGPAGE
jgi:LCP family protein required for cell wall assembly